MVGQYLGIWWKQPESMDPPRLVSTVKVDDGGLMIVGDVFLAHIGPLSVKWEC